MRVRFAPSPTGALHIGGIRTALYNYLLAKKQKGTFILRIEDTDRTRFVPGAEEYILEALNWLGISPDEGPQQGGEFGPYRQSERKGMYAQYAMQLVENGHAYYAFDTPEELNEMRERLKKEGNHMARYDQSTRMNMKNSLTMSSKEVKAWLDAGKPYTIRIKIPENEEVVIQDIVRGEVIFQSNELDDKVMLKTDGMPTYHMANIVDDHFMKITHVIRGEEWLSSTAHHKYLYKFLDWEDTMPQFAHLPLILKPVGSGKLSKRDGKKFGFPVFPLSWNADTEEESFTGFREAGYIPEALLNFLAFLGWNPGTEQEMYSLENLIEDFSLERVNKSGARFDIDKIKWFNQQYLHAQSNEEILLALRPLLKEKAWAQEDKFLLSFIDLMKERASFYPDILEKGYYFFEDVKEYDEKTIRKKWNESSKAALLDYQKVLLGLDTFSASTIEESTKSYLEEKGLRFGDLFPMLRVCLSGSTKGPSVFEMMSLFGKEKVMKRIETGVGKFSVLI